MAVGGTEEEDKHVLPLRSLKDNAPWLRSYFTPGHIPEIVTAGIHIRAVFD